jgi:methanogenic corrinoid protein MtbC1
LDLFDFVFTPALREIGFLWQTRSIDEAQEHFCAAFTQNILGILSAEHAGPGVPCSAIGFCVEGEMHDVAIRMLSESLFMHGWDSNVYGANVPARNVAPLIQRREPNLVMISVTMTGNLRSAQRSIAAIRAANLKTKPRILVGGRPFQICPALVAKIGADGTAASASHLIAQIAPAPGQ